MISAHDINVCVIGLGYVGLPVAMAMAEKYQTVGFDIDPIRIAELQRGIDSTLEIEKLDSNANIRFTSNPDSTSCANVYIVTVPSPINTQNQPDFSAIISASKMIARQLKAGDTVIYESTVYPGATEEVMVPVLEKLSELKLNDDFHVGYSPERINPGDKDNTIKNIVKVTSGSSEKAAHFVDLLYSSVLDVPTHLASSIKVAEAAKVIENCQRDLNIAFINELSKIFHAIGIDTNEVLEAASTKWNFHKYVPGLVGGHCIGVDPYYLTYKANQLGISADVILAGRSTNENVPNFIVAEMAKQLSYGNKNLADTRVLVLGGTFKENCPDFRNSKVGKLIREMNKISINPDLHDPYYCETSEIDMVGEFSWCKINSGSAHKYDVIVIATPHDLYKNLGLENIKNLGTPSVKIFDLKSIYAKELTDFRL